jgi:hypothetical protein
MRWLLASARPSEVAARFFDCPNAIPEGRTAKLSQFACMRFAFVVATDRMSLFTEPA